MNRKEATTIFECLSSGTRLDVFRLLVKRGLEGEVAGTIATSLKVSPSNLSFHLKALTNSELIEVEQEGRFQRFRANLSVMNDLIEYLTAECCSGHRELCNPVVAIGSNQKDTQRRSRR